MWVNADDQGRLAGDPEEVKYACCPNIDHITKADIPELLEELDANQLIKLYTTSKTKAIQILDWWDVHRPQWAWPSQYPPPEGWQDHLRYKRGAKEVVKENWFSQVSEDNGSGEQHAATQVSNEIVSGEQYSQRFLTTPKETEKERGKRRGRGNSPETQKGSQVRKPSPSPDDLCTDRNKISSKMMEQFRYCFGHVNAKEPRKVIPREPAAKELAQLRDLADELVRGGGVPLDYIRQAFREAGGQEIKSKRSTSYVAAILREWLGIERVRPP
ncbi:hypothetical protein KKE60_06225 [Patescibacteria group bacterium]|nr:hypothetical protein [Patescibacteria group bacterium]